MFDDPDEILSKTRAVDSEPTCVEMLAGPSLELRYALQELVFFSGPFRPLIGCHFKSSDRLNRIKMIQWLLQWLFQN